MRFQTTCVLTWVIFDILALLSIEGLACTLFYLMAHDECMETCALIKFQVMCGISIANKKSHLYNHVIQGNLGFHFKAQKLCSTENNNHLKLMENIFESKLI